MTDQDLGEFNDSTVLLQPICFNPKSVPTSKHTLPHNITLGIYDSIKLSGMIQSSGGSVIELIAIDSNSLNSFVTYQAEQLLQRYATQQICFITVVGNRTSGKSFFIDKLLNLAQVRGNHFCQKNNKGINIWSTPFDKDGLKIFFLEINHCNLDSNQFKILSTYATLISSAFIVVDNLEDNRSTIQQFDRVMSEIVNQITPSQIERGQDSQSNHSVFMPKTFYHLQRPGNHHQITNLNTISFYAQQELPDALQKGYKGKSSDLIHLPFMDTKGVNQDYIKRVANIFRDIYSKTQQKRYKELVLNGNIISKVIKYIQNYLNNHSSLNIDALYLRIIEDLYQSAYNYCILSYHQEMQNQFDDQKPKSFEYLLDIFERISQDTLEKFHQFNLDQELYQLYYGRLERHITDKEKMIMDINEKKTEQSLDKYYDPSQIYNVAYFRSLTDKVNKDCKHLNHGQAKFLGKVNSQFYMKTKGNNNVEYKIMKQIQSIKNNIREKQAIYEQEVKKNKEKNQKKSKLNKEQQQYLSKLEQVQAKVKKLNAQIDKTMRSSIIDPSTQKDEQKALTAKIAKNQKIIEELKSRNVSGDQRVRNLHNKIEETTKKCAMQQKLLQQLRNNLPKTEEPVRNAK